MNLTFGWASMWGYFAPAAFHGGFGLYEHRSEVHFVEADFENPRGLIADLKSATNPVPVYVRNHLDPAVRDKLFQTNTDVAVSRPLLVQEFNTIIGRPDLASEPVFATNKYSRGTTQLLNDPSAGKLRLNRLLLDESFPGDIRKSNHWLLRLPFFKAGAFLSLLSLFIVIRGMDGYMQAFGAPGMVKINAAWFNHRERGRFSGIFGFMINLGRFGIFTIGPALLAGTTVLWLIHVPPLHWRWLFWAPSILCAVVAICMALTVKQTPEEAGFPNVIADDSPITAGGGQATFGTVFRAIVTNPVVWVTACAYACTGAVRQAVDQWFPRYMQDLYHADLKSASFQFLAFLIPFVASVGSLTSGYVSDTLFKGRRAPVAAALYFAETLIILLAAQFHSVTAAITFLALISLTANSTHSILGSAAPMDIGGRKMAGFALGLIDSFQYFGGSLAGVILGRLLDQKLGYYFYFMAPFGFLGGLLMLTILGKVTRKGGHP
jgi:OPA family glycerol-3-phosphate transporter-like MFS transporter